MTVPDGSLASRILILAFFPAGMLWPAMMISFFFAMAICFAANIRIVKLYRAQFSIGQ